MNGKKILYYFIGGVGEPSGEGLPPCLGEGKSL